MWVSNHRTKQTQSSNTVLGHIYHSSRRTIRIDLQSGSCVSVASQWKRGRIKTPEVTGCSKFRASCRQTIGVPHPQIGVLRAALYWINIQLISGSSLILQQCLKHTGRLSGEWLSESSTTGTGPTWWSLYTQTSSLCSNPGLVSDSSVGPGVLLVLEQDSSLSFPLDHWR